VLDGSTATPVACFASTEQASPLHPPAVARHAVRIEEAKQIIETEDADLDEAGYRVGYEDPTFFRRLSKRQVGLTPAAYRKKFSGLCMKRPVLVEAPLPSQASAAEAA
jgi:AraC-like DNA-binding protein